MKKYLGAIYSILASGLFFVWMSISNLAQKSITTLGSKVTESDSVHSTGWELFKNIEDVKGHDAYKIFTIAGIIIAGLLILSAIILLLQNKKVIKTKMNFNFLNKILLTSFAFVTIGALISNIIIASELTLTLSGSEIGLNVSQKFEAFAGIGAWLNAIVSILLCVMAWLTKSGKRKR